MLAVIPNRDRILGLEREEVPVRIKRILWILGSPYEIGNLGRRGSLGNKHTHIYKYEVNLEVKGTQYTAIKRFSY